MRISAYLLTPLGDGSTRLETDGTFEFTNGFVKLMTPLILWQARKKAAMDLEHLRSLVESGKM